MPKPVQASTYTFRDIIENGFLYVDKTHYLYEMVRYGKGVYFLARPRRFGKSLMLSTLEEIFLGNRALFRGLWIDSSDYAWQRYPVIRLDFSANAVKSAANLEQVIDYYIEGFAQQYGITLRGFDYQSRFGNLIQQLAAEDKKVVILIDEYDKPIIDHLHDLPTASAIRDTLKNFYTTIKAMDRYLRFVFITGISKFSKVGVFSAMNNLDDLTMDPRFATALGITEAELRHDFSEHIADFATSPKKRSCNKFKTGMMASAFWKIASACIIPFRPCNYLTSSALPITGLKQAHQPFSSNCSKNNNMMLNY